MNGYMTIKETAELWGVSSRWIQTLCTRGDIEGAVKFGYVWAIPRSAEKPIDKRIVTGKYRNWRNNSKVEEKKYNDK